MLTEEEKKTFDEIVKTFPEIHELLINSPKHSFATSTKGYISRLFNTNTKSAIAGIYLITDKEGNPIYVGRSRNLAQRIGDDHRATQKSQANLTFKYAKLNNLTAIEARQYMYDNYFVQMVELNNEYARTLFEVYVAMKLETPFNSFRES